MRVFRERTHFIPVAHPYIYGRWDASQYFFASGIDKFHPRPSILPETPMFDFSAERVRYELHSVTDPQHGNFPFEK
jgi:hypothetical protein